MRRPRKSKTSFARMTVAAYRKLAPENGRAGVRRAVCEYLSLCHIPYSITDGALIFDESGEIAGRAVTCDGWPDITGCLPGGRMLAIETKTARGRLRPAQIACLGTLEAAGALVIIAHSIDDVRQQLAAPGTPQDVAGSK